MQKNKYKRLANNEREGISRGMSQKKSIREIPRGAYPVIEGEKAAIGCQTKEKHERILNKLTEMYQGFGPTLASEKLLERDGIKVRKETFRQMTIAAVVHQPKIRRKDKAHPLRALQKRRGELVQIDGSYHAWLEERGEKACLLLFLAAIIMVGHLMDLESIRNEIDLVGEFYQRKFIVPEDPGFGTAMGVLAVLKEKL